MKYKGIVAGVLMFSVMMPVFADKYVSDVLWVTLHSAADDNSPSVRVLKSGTQLQVLDTAEVNEYLHVKTTKGDEGWIKSRYLLDDPTAALQLDTLKDQLQKLQDENTQLKADIESVHKDAKETDLEHKRMISENSKLVAQNKKLKAVAQKPLELAQENDKLKVDNARLKKEYDKMSEKFSTIKSDGQRIWFMTGAGVLFAGIILGIIFPNLRFRRRSSW